MAKTYTNLFERIYDFENLYQAYLKARKGKQLNHDVAKFSSRLEENLITLQNELIWQTYRTGNYYLFQVREPKVRTVAALPFRDRVIHHAIINVIEPLFERVFIYDSYACRVGRGTHAGADRAQRFLRIVKRNHGKFFVLKADISKYFASIDHDVLMRLLEKRIRCKPTLDLLQRIIDASPLSGLPIGNLTSQLFANIYLHELDEFCKYEVKAKYYLRYMDDFVIVHHNKAVLHDMRQRIEWFLASELKLKTNHKTQVYPINRDRPLDFLGYKIWPTHRKLRNDSIKRFKRKMLRFQGRYYCGTIELSEVRQSIMTWLAHASKANAHDTTRRILSGIVFKREPL